jgi:hypothetical protein
MAVSKCAQLIKAASQTNRLSAKTFFALHKRSPSRAAFVSNKSQCRRRISPKEFGMLRARRIAAYLVPAREFTRAKALAVECRQSVNAVAFCWLG